MAPTRTEAFKTWLLPKSSLCKLTDRLKGLNKSVMNLALPDHQSRDLFEDSLKLVDLSPDAEKETEELSATASLQMVKWGISDEAKALPLSKLSMWRPLLDKVDYFERAGFKIKKSHFLNDAQSEFETELLFDGVASNGLREAKHGQSQAGCPLEKTRRGQRGGGVPMAHL